MSNRPEKWRNDLVNYLPPSQPSVYRHFWDARRVPFHARSEGDFDRGRCWWLAEVSRTAYLDPPHARNDYIQGFGQHGYAVSVSHEPRERTERGAFWYCIEADDFAIVVFRGSEVPSRVDHTPQELMNAFKDWVVTDANLFFVDWEYAGAQVHCGFYKAYRELVPLEGRRPGGELLGRVVELARRGLPIWVTGHSLGGAMASLLASELANMRLPSLARPIVVEGVYTFGAPYVGDRQFVESLNDVPAYRVVNDLDLAARVPRRSAPLPWLGERYAHYGELVLYDRNGRMLRGSEARRRERDNLLALGAGAVTSFLLPSKDIPKLSMIRAVPKPMLDHAPILYSIHAWENL
ncbi:lipase family protein [Parachitinimonas caeni]|uniref:Lipase family protein n=1 Tax=Parachitinimonas caeni TaxID=3031301 RepID=A0ABT7E0W5_9NEIS|nr:lipase family protein [Parachitinimonas caeni]MDK2124557.1 lipase family protein [Parachitinimonas caeni]